MQFEVIVGDLISAYDNDDVVAGKTATPGALFYDDAREAWFQFLQNAGTTDADIDEKLACVSLGTQKSLSQVQLPAAEFDPNFRGVRVPGAETLLGAPASAGQWGWFQISGTATFYGAATANVAIVIAANTGLVEAIPATTSAAAVLSEVQGIIAQAQATVSGPGDIIARIK